MQQVPVVAPANQVLYQANVADTTTPRMWNDLYTASATDKTRQPVPHKAFRSICETSGIHPRDINRTVYNILRKAFQRYASKCETTGIDPGDTGKVYKAFETVFRRYATKKRAALSPVSKRSRPNGGLSQIPKPESPQAPFASQLVVSWTRRIR